MDDKFYSINLFDLKKTCIFAFNSSSFFLVEIIEMVSY